MSKHDDDFEFEALLSVNQEEEEQEADEKAEGIALTDEQLADIQTIESTGLELGGNDGKYLNFHEAGKNLKVFQRKRYFVSFDSLREVAEAIANFEECDAYTGVVKDDGSYVEYLLQAPSPYLQVGSIFGRREWGYDRSECGHEFDQSMIQARSRDYPPGFHLTSPSGDTCVEISRISMIAGFMVSNGRHRRLSPPEYTLKVMVSSLAGRAAKVNAAQAVADSLLFEFDVKHDLPINLIPRSNVPALSRRRRASRGMGVSFPSTAIPREVAALFAFAAEASDNPPFAFLSYYQVLEYYMPLTSRRDALKRIRRELRDFSFDISNDAHVLRVLNSAERVKGVSEEDALKILSRDCVREDKLKEFFKSDDFAHHFSRKGPIMGVPVVNLNATNESVPVQAARRVYALRNRIVHAKDDPKYAETPQLLPRSGEANSLGPDVMLARFLALETIADTQD
ncbi:hypothetical protein OG864_24795 [Streptomyces sp. NBC_00124]|uniref:hypothetical protein n=1 Tax=Streptomyces sp. NBC_00124 TaxID=2975662 RepID=UPI002251F95C|nr:hypothetical protein [Streptomyces sp. NBC_00124]MCX5361930.1 hypothetical protein [Streptomyces sp. NBC_00124]